MASDVHNLRIVVTLDIDDPTVTDAFKQQIYDISPYIFIAMGISESKIHAINRDMPDTSQFDVLLLMSDDMVIQVHGYDKIIREYMQTHYPDTDGVLFFNDGHQGKHLNTIVICGSKYYTRFGYIYFPRYKSFYCDNEFTETAFRLRRQTYFDKVIIRHMHPNTTPNVPSDALYDKNQAFLKEDYDLYIERMRKEWDPIKKRIKFIFRITR
jgi:hypothetical protein